MSKQSLTRQQKRYVNNFFSLPRYYGSLGEVEDVQPGQLKAEALERIHQLSLAVQHDLTGFLSYELYQNYPNPFNNQTTIMYQLRSEASVSLRIYDVLGQEICTLVHERQLEGYYMVEWNGTNNTGQRVSSGIYIYHLHTPQYTYSRKLVLLK
jgi:hypothetical protein